MTYRAALATPLGDLTVTSREGQITTVDWGRGPAPDATTPPELVAALEQLDAYFNGALHTFDLPLSVEGSGFQRAACDAMLGIPFGETRTYGDLAVELGASAQAVGMACGGNPIPVIIPCHRILGAQSLGGYSGAGGVETKVWLLRHEGAAGLLI